MNPSSSAIGLAASAAGAAGGTTSSFYMANSYGRFGGNPPAWNSAGTNTGMRTNAANQVAIALNAQVARRVVTTRIQNESNSAILSNYRTIAQTEPGLEDVITGMLVFRCKRVHHMSGGRTSHGQARGVHARVTTVWAAFNFISNDELINAVFVGVADGVTFAENLSVGPHDKRLAVCVWGMRTIKNTGGRTIHRGDTVVWGAPYVRHGPSNTVQQEHTFQGMHKDLLTASVWPLAPGSDQANVGVMVSKLLLGNSTTVPELTPHLTRAARWYNLGQKIAQYSYLNRSGSDNDHSDNEDIDNDGGRSSRLYNADDGSASASSKASSAPTESSRPDDISLSLDGGQSSDRRGDEDDEYVSRRGPAEPHGQHDKLVEFLIQNGCFEDTDTAIAKSIMRDLDQASKMYDDQSAFHGLTGFDAAIFQRVAHEFAQYYKTMMSRRIGVAQSRAEPGEQFDILLSY